AHLPLTSAMAVTVRRADPSGVELAIPLEPNLNHEGTAFGGSISTGGILAGWGLLWVRTQRLPQPPRLVIAHSSTRYIRPVGGDFKVVCHAPNDKLCRQFEETLAATGKARLALRSELTCDGKIAAVHDGVYVALRADPPAGKAGA
ncbi:MAG: YiiD C-terminal domain-containing protein, partial [Planctomycetota bacterium]